MANQGLRCGFEMATLDDIINRLLNFGNSSAGEQFPLTEAEIGQLCLESRDIFLSQPNLLELEGHLKILGDIHGHYSDLLRFFELGGFPPHANYVFLGNYVDWGGQSLETICLLLAYKIKFPENFFLLRGNHECASMNRICGFYDECKRRMTVRVWKKFTDCFDCLPVAALIDCKILCMHGGLSPKLTNLEQIRRLRRPSEVPDRGLLHDLLWADPDKDVKGWGMKDRDASYTFGPDRLSKFLKKHDLDLVCRGHQVVEDGYEFFADRQLVTIFSAPDFCGEHENFGAMMNVDENLLCSFQILKPADKTTDSSENDVMIAAAEPPKLQCDIHGHYSDLLRFFQHEGFPSHANYVFLGNYVDSGKQSLQTIYLLLAYKIKFPEDFFLLRGNHECESMNRKYVVYDECKCRMTVRVWKKFIDCFNCLPVAALIKCNILCMHGDLSSKLTNLDQIRSLPRPRCSRLWSAARLALVRSR